MVPYVPVLFHHELKTYFAFRIDVWDDAGDTVGEHGVRGRSRGLLRGVRD
jgi:hypothetical protein